MAQNDFISEYYSPGDVGFGVSILNSSLSNPLTSSVQCRCIDPAFQTNTDYTNHFWLKNSQYINIPFTKSISQRIWGRLSVSSPTPNGTPRSGVCLMAKHSPINSYSIVETNTSVYPRSGYETFLCSLDNSINFGITFSAGGVNAGGSTTNSIVTVSSNTWLGIRMDVIPLVGNVISNNILVSGTTGDLVEIYTASLASPDNWQKIYSTQIGTGDSRYVPWGNYTIKSTQFSSVTNMNTDAYNGFGVRRAVSNSKNTAYWDDYQIYVIDAF